MREALLTSLQERILKEISNQNPLKFLKTLKIEEYADTIVSVVYLYTRPKKGLNKQAIYLVELISALGHAVRNKAKLKRDSGLAAKTGAFILYSFEQAGILQVALGQGNKGHASYIVQILEDDTICELWNQLEPSKVEKLPSEVPYESWKTARHPAGISIVKTGNKEVLDTLTPDTHPIVFSCLNKAQEIGWNINRDVFELHSWALRNKTDAFADIWDAQNPEAKSTKLREAKAIGDIAKKFLDKTFYHLYYFDFRGRKYPASAYLHEQGSDLARGLLLRADSTPIGKDGFFWLLVSIASSWAGDAGREDGAKTDKIPLNDRAAWVIDNEEIILSYAESPKVNQGWMKADKPWQFIAACIELMKFRIWQSKISNFDNYEYPSKLEVYIDGL